MRFAKCTKLGFGLAILIASAFTGLLAQSLSPRPAPPHSIPGHPIQNPLYTCVFWDDFEDYSNTEDFIRVNSGALNGNGLVHFPDNRLRWELINNDGGSPKYVNTANGPRLCEVCQYDNNTSDRNYFDILEDESNPTNHYLRLSAHKGDQTPCKVFEVINNRYIYSDTVLPYSRAAIIQRRKIVLPMNQGRYGYWESRVRMTVRPTEPWANQGIGPTFWLWPYHQPPQVLPKPCWSEIDIFETFEQPRNSQTGPQNGLGGNLHFTLAMDTCPGVDDHIARLYGNDCEAFGDLGRIPADAYQPAMFLDDSLWHTFGMEWAPGHIAWYVDGQLIDWVAKSASGCWRNAPYIDSLTNMITIMSIVIDGTYGRVHRDSTLFPYHYDIDYVRIYQYPIEDSAARGYVWCHPFSDRGSGVKEIQPGWVSAAECRETLQPLKPWRLFRMRLMRLFRPNK